MSADQKEIGKTSNSVIKIQAWDAMQAWMTQEQFIGYLLGNTIKHIAQAEEREGLEDYRQALNYLEKLTEVLEQQKPKTLSDQQ